ncbi:MAG TPA: NAD(P)H-dependent oxidoreductase subunit E [Acidimicrobiales bacterium]|nr:NAD(P)H-dependent oxidoreductase subunit E [Acidimicrobiales bacterium]
MAHLNQDIRQRAEELVALYPEPRSALIPICHLAQEQDGWLRPEAMEEIADLVGVTPAEVRGTATFYDMLHTEPVGTYLVSVCTNIACLLGGALELLDHAEQTLGIRVGGTTADGAITLEEAECLADCDRTVCVQVNHRYVGGQDPESFDQLVDDLRAGRRSDDIPPHGTLVRVRRSVPLQADRRQVVAERAAVAAAQADRAAAARAEQAAGQQGGGA